MKRELYFRVWQWHRNRINGRMRHNGFLIASQLGSGEVEAYVPNADSSSSLMIMQYTGLKDKDGREVFEGDVVRASMGGVSEVMFLNGQYVGATHSDPEGFLASMPLVDLLDGGEIIGNIYEHPELVSHR